MARLIEAVLRDEKLFIPVGAHSREHGVTLSLPSVVGAAGVESVLQPRLDGEEREALAKSIAYYVRRWHAVRRARLSPTRRDTVLKCSFPVNLIASVKERDF
jgi:malate/lactate dehydrogenase